MKRLAAFTLAAMMLASIPLTVYAQNVTTLTTTVPDATYTLNIPADQTITFGATSTEIGDVTVSDASGFAEGKNLEVTITYAAFTSAGVSTTIPYTIQAEENGTTEQRTISSGGRLKFHGGRSDGLYEGAHFSNSPKQGSGKLDSPLKVVIESTDWGKALGGDYTAELVFTAEVVVE